MFTPRLRVILNGAQLPERHRITLIRADIVSVRTLGYGLELSELQEILGPDVSAEVCRSIHASSCTAVRLGIDSACRRQR